eukprot:scaffold24263_cov69-Phaeocystis_antarctica.AAC.12
MRLTRHVRPYSRVSTPSILSSLWPTLIVQLLLTSVKLPSAWLVARTSSRPWADSVSISKAARRPTISPAAHASTTARSCGPSTLASALARSYSASFRISSGAATRGSLRRLRFTKSAMPRVQRPAPTTQKLANTTRRPPGVASGVRSKKDGQSQEVQEAWGAL